MDMDAKSELGWSLSSFGHGMFQQIVMKPIVNQGRGCPMDTTCSSVLLADQPVVVGVLLSKPQGYKGSNVDFTSYIEKAIHHIEFGFSVLHEGSNVLHETFYLAALQQSSCPTLESALCVTEIGVAVTFNTSLNIAKQYLNIPLQFLVTMNLIQSQGKPFNQRLIMDKTEMNVRLLMDLNRYRPQKVPERSLVLPIQIVHPLRVSSSVREVTADLSVLSITVRNVHDTAHISLQDVIFHTSRMTQSVVKAINFEQNLRQDISSDLFQISLLNPNHTNTGSCSTKCPENCIYGVVIPPKEAYTLLYSITMRDATQSTLYTNFSLYTTPITLYWCVDHSHCMNTISGALSPPSAILTNTCHQSELDFVASWSIGSETSTNTKDTHILNNAYTTGITDCDTALQLTLHGPAIVYTDEKFDLRVCVTNRTAGVVEAPVLHARSRICGSAHSQGQYLAHEAMTSFGDIAAGASLACIMHITPLSVGSLSIRDLFLTSTASDSRQCVYQMQFPFQTLVQERLESVEL